MANCKKCNDWISIHQNLYHDGLCVDQEIHTGLAGNWSDEERAIANSRLNSDKPLQLSKTEIHKRRQGQLLHNRFVAEGKGIPLPMPLTKKPLTIIKRRDNNAC